MLLILLYLQPTTERKLNATLTCGSVGACCQIPDKSLNAISIYSKAMAPVGARHDVCSICTCMHDITFA